MTPGKIPKPMISYGSHEDFIGFIFDDNKPITYDNDMATSQKPKIREITKDQRVISIIVLIAVGIRNILLELE